MIDFIGFFLAHPDWLRTALYVWLIDPEGTIRK